MQHAHACVHACLLPQESWIAHAHAWMVWVRYPVSAEDYCAAGLDGEWHASLVGSMVCVSARRCNVGAGWKPRTIPGSGSPVRADCSHYMKTGDCQYGAIPQSYCGHQFLLNPVYKGEPCKFNHQPNQGGGGGGGGGGGKQWGMVCANLHTCCRSSVQNKTIDSEPWLLL